MLVLDNAAVVEALNSGTARDSLLMHLLRSLHFYLVHHDISLSVSHVAGIENTAADASSTALQPLSTTDHPQSKLSPSVPQGPATASVPRVALSDLEEYVFRLLANTVAPSTLHSYQSGQRRFLQFYAEAGVQPLPMSENLLSWYVAHLASKGSSPQTIK